MAIGETCQLRIVGRYQGQNIVQTLHYLIETQAVGEEAILLALIEAWESNLEADFLARHIDTYELVGYKAFQVDGASKTPAFKASGDAGTVVGEEVTSSVCRTITLYTDNANSRKRGRMMLSGGAVSMFNTDDGAVTSTEVTALTAFGGSLETVLTSGETSWALCLPPTVTDAAEKIIEAKGRVTPSLVRSRRIKQFLIG